MSIVNSLSNSNLAQAKAVFSRIDTESIFERHYFGVISRLGGTLKVVRRGLRHLPTASLNTAAARHYEAFNSRRKNFNLQSYKRQLQEAYGRYTEHVLPLKYCYNQLDHPCSAVQPGTQDENSSALPSE
jgi:hypothetical protein